MIFPFKPEEFVYAIKDVERCPYTWRDDGFVDWLKADDRRKLLLALDRYSRSLTCKHRTIRVVTNYGVFERCDKCERYVYLGY